jgi:hypothetical protein
VFKVLEDHNVNGFYLAAGLADLFLEAHATPLRQFLNADAANFVKDYILATIIRRDDTLAWPFL